MNENKKIFQLGDKMIILDLGSPNFEFSVEDILRIDYSNILGEMLTFSVILNRVGLLLADMSNQLKLQEFDLEKMDKDVKREKAKAYERVMDQFKLDGVKSPTVAQIESKILSDLKVIEKERERDLVKAKTIDVERDRDYISTLYWSAKSKDTKLDNLKMSIRPEDFSHEIVDGKINGILIKTTKALIG